MYGYSARFSIPFVLLLASVTPMLAQAQPKSTIGDDYRDLFKKPETLREFWDAMQFEIEVGRYDLASRHLKGLLDKSTNLDELLQVEEKEGMSAFLRLQNISQWFDDPKQNAQAKKDVATLIQRVSIALEQKLGDPKRIDKFIKNLNATPEERIFALRELYRSGAVAVPRLVETLRAATPEDKVAILTALPRLGENTIPPLLAALDIDDPELRVHLIDVFQKKAETRAVPHLWYLADSATQPASVRKKATEALAYLLDTPAGKLAAPKVALGKEAERYYQHQVHFPDSGAVTIWRWDGKQIVAGWPGVKSVSAAKAEEYYGLRFAQQALALDPAYQPAQVVFLSLALEKAFAQTGPDKLLSRGAPVVNELLTTASPELVVAVLEKALAEQRIYVILGAVQALGDLAEVRALRPTGHGEPVLVRALNFPDRRVQLAAAQTVLRMPGPASTQAGTRVVEVLRRALAAELMTKSPAAIKVLIGYAKEDVATAVSQALTQAGAEPIVMRTGRDVLLRLNEAADIDALLIDVNLPDPGLASLLAQLRADIHAGFLPVLLAVPREREDYYRRLTERQRNVYVIAESLALDAEALKRMLTAHIVEAMIQPLSVAERKANGEGALRSLARMARGEVPGFDVQPAADAVLEALRSTTLSNEAQQAALETVGVLPGAKAQNALATFLLDVNRPVPLRSTAAVELVRHIQKHSPALNPGVVRDLQTSLNQTTDVALKAHIASVVGSMQRDPNIAGERLRVYSPPAPHPPMPPAPPSPAPAPPPQDK